MFLRRIALLTHRQTPFSFLKLSLITAVFILPSLACNLTSRMTPASEESGVVISTEAAEITETPAPEPTPTSAPPPAELSFSEQTAVSLPADGSWMNSAGGVSASLPANTLPADAPVQLTEFAVDPAWRALLEQDYSIDSPFVSLTTTGLNDGTGKAALRLPAPSANSQLVAIVDNTYLAIVNAAAEGGYLETAVSPTTTDASSPEQAGSLVPGGSLHFVVLTPKTEGTAPDRDRVSKPARQNGRSCAPPLTGRTAAVFDCRQNEAGTVQVQYLADTGLSSSEGDQIANAMAAAMDKYTKLGFTAAQLNPNAPMRVVVQKGLTDPQYRSFNGVIYLPPDIAKNISGEANHEMLHEMAHWIQDEEYNMAWAFWRGGKTWWLETAAENMVMLYDEAYIPINLNTYGAISTDNNRLALQQSPYQWPGDFYVHAQLVKLNMCADAAVCPFTEKSFAEAINQGAYPFDDDAAQAKLSSNLDAYARYLLGVAPDRANTAMPLSGPVASGSSYGEYIDISQSRNNDFTLRFNGYAPQMQTGSDNLGETVEVAAIMQKDGVYPLTINSGINGRNPGRPSTLIVQAGAPFWYRLGGAAPQYHDGQSELVLQPIHATMGIPSVRLTALNNEAGEKLFRARLTQPDLQGVWIFTTPNQISSDIVCQSATNESESASMDPEIIPLLTSLGSLLGDFRPDAAGGGLTWEINNSRLPLDFYESGVTFKGAALPGPNDIKVQTEFDWPKASQSRWPGSLSFGLIAMVGAVPGVWALKDRRRRPYWSFLSLALVAILLAGCVGFNIWGHSTANMTFTEMEYVGGEGIPIFSSGNESGAEVEPVWILRGTAVFDGRFYSEVVSENETGLASCVGSAAYAVEARIYKDIEIVWNE